MPLIHIEDTRRRERRRSVTCRVGGVPVGGGHPVVVQSMTNTDTADPAATAGQVSVLAAAGSELVRVTVNTREAAAQVPEIARRLRDNGNPKTSRTFVGTLGSNFTELGFHVYLW